MEWMQWGQEMSSVGSVGRDIDLAASRRTSRIFRDGDRIASPKCRLRGPIRYASRRRVTLSSSSIVVTCTGTKCGKMMFPVPAYQTPRN
jgi:hypothetical protein